MILPDLFQFRIKCVEGSKGGKLRRGGVRKIGGHEGYQIQRAAGQAQGRPSVWCARAGQHSQASASLGEEWVAKIADASDADASAVGAVGPGAEVDIAPGHNFKDSRARHVDVANQRVAAGPVDQGDLVGGGDEIGLGQAVGEHTPRGAGVVGDDVAAGGDDTGVAGAIILQIEGNVCNVLAGHQAHLFGGEKF